MISTLGLNINFLKRESFSGSYQGMRFTFQKSEAGITVYAYPEPWNLASTPEKDIIKKDFDFSSDGLEAGIQWLNDLYEEKKEDWIKAGDDFYVSFMGKDL